MKIISVVGYSSNFMKIAPGFRTINNYNKASSSTHNTITHILIYTGRHYDDFMSIQCFEELYIHEVDFNFCIGRGSYAEQYGKTMIEFEMIFRLEKINWVELVNVNDKIDYSVKVKKKMLHIAIVNLPLVL